MKKIKLKIILFTFLAGNILFPDILKAQNKYEKIFKDYTYYFSETKDEINTGTKLRFSLADSIIAVKNNEITYGLSLFTDNYIKMFPCKIMIGRLSASGGMSKLSSPELSSPSSSFSSSYSTPLAISCNIPSFSSFTNPLGIFAETKYKNKDNLLEELLLNYYYNIDERNSGLSSKIKLNFSKNIYCEYILCFHNYESNEKTPTSWFGSPYFKKDNLFSLSNCFKLNLNAYKGNFSVYSYKTNYGNIDNIFKTENEITTKYFNFGLSGFFNTSNNVVTSNNTKIDPKIELKTNLIITIPFSNIKNKIEETKTSNIKISIAGFDNISLLDDSHNLICGIGSILSWNMFSTGINFNIDYLISQKNNSINYISGKFLSKWNSKYLYPEFIFSCKYYFNKTADEDGKFVISPGTQSYKITMNCKLLEDYLRGFFDFSFLYKQGKITDKNIKISLKSHINLKTLIIIMNLMGEFDI